MELEKAVLGVLGITLSIPITLSLIEIIQVTFGKHPYIKRPDQSKGNGNYLSPRGENQENNNYNPKR